MLDLIVDATLTNGLGLSLKDGSVRNFFELLINLEAGKKIHIKDFTCSAAAGSFVEDTTFPETQKAYVKINDSYKYLAVEIPDIRHKKEEFAVLCDHLKPRLPIPYKALFLGMTPTALSELFSRRSVLLFTFKDDYLKMVSTLAYGTDIDDYKSQISVRKDNLLPEEGAYLKEVLNCGTVSFSPSSGGGYNYYNSYYCPPSKLVLFVKENYFRVNAYEFNGESFSLMLMRKSLKGTYSSNQSYGTLISALVLPSGIVNPANTDHTGQTLLQGCGLNNTLTKNIYPVVVNDYPDPSLAEENYYVNVPLSNDDTDFLTAVNEIDNESIYSKHRCVLAEDGVKVVRGCKAIFNSTKSLKVLVRDDKKRASDILAYDNRMFRDYLSHAISLVCIPIFQKEFTIPEYLQKSFDFRMATLDCCYYNRSYGRPRPRHNERYYLTFRNDSNDPNWVMPSTDFTLPIQDSKIKAFVKGLKDRTLTSTTQSRSSLFTREFVEPNLETSNSYYMPNTSAIFGWMFNMDNQEQHGWSYKLSSAHLLRSSAPRGYYHAECGLMTDKTFGLKSVMNHVFTKTDFTGLHRDYCSTRPDQYLGGEKKAAHISAVLDIFTANFVPHDTVEYALKSWGKQDYDEVVVPVNQLLFLSEESLVMLHALYKCKSFEDLATCLDFCMPLCLEMVDTLGYEKPLRDHVYAMMTYFWNTTTAISQEMNPNDTIEK